MYSHVTPSMTCSRTRRLDRKRTAGPCAHGWATWRCHWAATAGGLPLQVPVRMSQQFCLPLSLSVCRSVCRQVPVCLSVRVWVYDGAGGRCVFGEDVGGNGGRAGDGVDHAGGYRRHRDHPCCHGDAGWRRVDGDYLAPRARGRAWGLLSLSCGYQWGLTWMKETGILFMLCITHVKHSHIYNSPCPLGCFLADLLPVIRLLSQRGIQLHLLNLVYTPHQWHHHHHQWPANML